MFPSSNCTLVPTFSDARFTSYKRTGSESLHITLDVITNGNRKRRKRHQARRCGLPIRRVGLLRYPHPYLQQKTRLTELRVGDEATKRDLEQRALSFDPEEFLKHKTPSLTEVANVNMQSGNAGNAATLYNAYEGNFAGRQLTETVDDFLERLPPATTQATDLVRWIYIWNPYQKASKREEHDHKEVTGEAPPDEESDWAQLVVLGGNLLAELTTIQNTIEKQKAGQAKATITKTVNIQKDKIVKKLLETAVELHCTSGKVK